jgi:outer membrane protein assembly factor BamB
MKIRVVLTVLTALAVASCTTEAQPPPTTARPEPTLKPLKLAAEPAWTTENDVAGLDVRDGLALAVSDEHLTLIDVETGKPRWDIESSGELRGGDGAEWIPLMRARPRLVAHDGGLAVLAEYFFWTDCETSMCSASETEMSDEKGLVLLSAEDGHVLWKEPVVPVERDQDHEPHTSMLWAVDDRVALVAVTPGTLPVDRVPVDQLHAVAYDVGTGKKLWEQNGMWPVAIAGDTVLASAGENEPDHLSPGFGELTGGRITGLDVVTGKPKWDLAGRFDRGEVVMTGGDVMLVRGAADGSVKSESAVFGTNDGLELTVIGGEDAGECATDGRVVACSDEHRLSLYDATEDKLTHVGLDGKWFVGIAREGRIFLNDGDKEFSVDAAGNRIDEDLPGSVLAVTADHIYVKRFASYDNPGQVSCYVLSG